MSAPLQFLAADLGAERGRVMLGAFDGGRISLEEVHRFDSHADSYDDLVRMASAAPPLRSLVDADHPDFAKPADMPARIRAYCQRTGQPVPEGKGEIVRCALDSLALKYRLVLDEMEGILGRRLEPLHIVGGGARNRLLCQLAVDATARVVEAGPVEATAAGSIVLQAMALGRVGSLSEARDLVRRSFEVECFEPRLSPAMDEALARLRLLAAVP